ncbi:leucine-rich repeat-containing 46 [Brachionus plicatilis]|uniref:Leucine-rich repeat-containing 46 n=1 Tax=Brachionus plicatilis TaxID=10195 RepID=A0A3M7QN18_BRAPC|nr:leucine-rich repeat-containing 46 [Brachionus plicatilis]
MKITHQIKNLEGFSKFMAIGTLNLHGNEFNWTELERIRHLHIVDFIASNNLKNCASSAMLGKN